jgi:hypothetical protein
MRCRRADGGMHPLEPGDPNVTATPSTGQSDGYPDGWALTAPDLELADRVEGPSGFAVALVDPLRTAAPLSSVDPA